MLFLEVVEEYRHPDLVLSTGFSPELDLFYPKLNLAFEYQVKKARENKVTVTRGNNIIKNWVFCVTLLLSMKVNFVTLKKNNYVKKKVRNFIEISYN